MLNIYKLNEKLNKLSTSILSGKQGKLVFDAKHYPAVNNEWFNSIYTFNSNTQKSIPSLDLYVAKLIRSYFNMFSLKLEVGTRTRRVRIWKRRLRTNRILIAKPEFKHTNDKVIVTLHIYNRQLINFTKKIKIFKSLVLSYFFKENISKKKYLNKIKLIKIPSQIQTLVNMFSKNIKSDINYTFNKTVKFNIEKLAFINFLRKMLKTLKTYLRLRKIIYSNKSKFNSIHIIPLKKSLELIYGKRVEFNLISIKSYHLNSSILTQILTIKLRNRKNRLLKVIDKVLNRVRLPFLSVLEYKQKIYRNKQRQNFVIKNNLNSVLPNTLMEINSTEKNIYLTKHGDKLNSMLELYHPNEYISQDLKDLNKEQMVLNTINNKTVVGIRIEASGRLTKRIIASRAIFKMRQKGTIKNINSSYKGISSVLLRGNFKSSIQCSRSSQKTRIGAFGLKGWINSI